MQEIYNIGASPSGSDMASAARRLGSGDLMLLPTETVYGVGVSVAAYARYGDEMPPEDSGYRRIFSLKQRSLAQTVPWLVSGVADLDRFGRNVPDEIRALATACWPGALTVVVEASDEVPAFMRASDGTVALRSSASPVVAALVRACASPLAVTSANTHGLPAPCSFAEVEARILEGVDAAIDAGETACRDASTIVSYQDGALRVLREGAIASERLHAVLGDAE